MSSRFWTMYQFTAPFRGGRRVPSPDQSPTSTPCVKGAFGVLRIPLRSTLDPLRSGLRLAPTGDAGGVGHDTPVSDNGTEHSGISVPGPGRLATGKIIKRRPSEVLRDEEVRRQRECSPLCWRSWGRPHSEENPMWSRLDAENSVKNRLMLDVVRVVRLLRTDSGTFRHSSRTVRYRCCCSPRPTTRRSQSPIGRS